MQSTVSIRRKALWRIGIVSVFMAVVLGVVQSLYQLELIDDQVVSRAMSESRTALTLLHLVQHQSDGHPQEQASVNELLHTLHQSFAIIELYDQHHTKSLESVREGYAWLEDQLKVYPSHGFGYDGEPYYRKLWLNDAWYWQVVLPITNRQGLVEGYFEGIYNLSVDDEHNLKQTIVFSVLMVVLATLMTGLTMYPLLLLLTRRLEHQSKAVLKGNIELMEVMGEAISRRDSDTNIHNYRVTLYAIKLAEVLHYPKERMAALIAGAFLHDVGKIGIPDAILLKAGKLSDEEFAVMKTHVEIGAHILQRASWLADARDIPLYHHEKYDGSGYALGLIGAQIPLSARIFAVVDVFDALTAERPYKKAMSLQAALAILQEGVGQHFDPAIVDAFMQHAAEWYEAVYCRDQEAIVHALEQSLALYFAYH